MLSQALAANGHACHQLVRAPPALDLQHLLGFCEASKEGAQPTPNRKECARGGAKAAAKRGEAFALKITTANGTCWGSILEYLTTTGSHVVCAQEHKLLVHQIEGANATANTLGWQAVWQPARLTKKDGASGGVAIFARASVGITRMEISTDHPRRLVAARIEAPGNQVFACIACYLDTLLKGIKGGNLDVVADIGQFAAEAEMPTLAGGDYNCDPDVMVSTGFLRKTQSVAMATPKDVPTCYTKHSESRIDYFLCFGGIENCIMDISTERAEAIKTHRPVTVTFAERAVLLRMKKLMIPKALPKKSRLVLPLGPGLALMRGKQPMLHMQRRKLAIMLRLSMGTTLLLGSLRTLLSWRSWTELVPTWTLRKALEGVCLKQDGQPSALSRLQACSNIALTL